jgi:hypothetical protein
MDTMSRGSRVTGSRGLAVVSVVLVAVVPVVLGTATGAGAAPRVAADGSGLPAPFVGTSSAPRGGQVISTSLDWAGFAATGPTVTSVTGSWLQPSVACPASKLEQSAFWVGIDGFSSSDPTVQQVGTDADCAKKAKKVPGGPVYYAWFEMYPASLVVLNPSTYPVNPGDALTASVTAVGANYTLALIDAGHWTFTTTQVAGAPLPLNSSAEWIAEAPTSCAGSSCKAVPLADFGSVAFSGATVNGLPVNGAGLTSSQITMTKNKKGTQVKASTSALDVTGHAFGVTWVSN